MKSDKHVTPAVPEKLAEHFELYRDYVKHEDELINRRLTWLLTVQGFLFAAYGLTNQGYSASSSAASFAINPMKDFAGSLPHIFASVDLLVGILAFLGVLAAQVSVWAL
jgi:hypothetical protein